MYIPEKCVGFFHTIPQPGEEGFESWDNKEAYLHIGGANAGLEFSLDEEKELCLHQLVRQFMIFMEAKEQAIIYSPIQYWH
jgi:hypothetical protein